MKAISNVASWVFLPLFMPIYALLVVFYVPSNQDYLFNEDCMYLMHDTNKLVVLFEYGLFGVVLPGLSILIMRFTGMITTVEMDARNERHLPMVVTAMYCGMLYSLLSLQFKEVPAPKYVIGLALSGICISIVYYTLNRWRKVSVHAGGAGIVFGFFVSYVIEHAEYQLWILGAAILVSGFLMTARLYLKKHTMFEVVLGWFVGSVVTFMVNYLV
jgi:membrane-associated phospholipid phosphatase